MALQIDSHVPIPLGRSKYPFQEMEPGDSILFLGARKANSARVSALRFVRVHQPTWAFQLRKVEQGWRLWRIA